jgi:hypothetical protein
VPFHAGNRHGHHRAQPGPKLSERLGQPTVIDNRPGASGNLGAELVARAAPDGHTLMVSGNPLITSPHLYRNVPYKPLADFAPISLAAWGTMMLVAHPGAKINSVPDSIAQAKPAREDQLRLARHRHAAPHVDGAVQGPDRRQPPARAVQGHGEARSPTPSAGRSPDVHADTRGDAARQRRAG